MIYNLVVFVYKKINGLSTGTLQQEQLLKIR